MQRQSFTSSHTPSPTPIPPSSPLLNFNNWMCEWSFACVRTETPFCASVGTSASSWHVCVCGSMPTWMCVVVVCICVCVCVRACGCAMHARCCNGASFRFLFDVNNLDYLCCMICAVKCLFACLISYARVVMILFCVNYNYCYDKCKYIESLYFKKDFFYKCIFQSYKLFCFFVPCCGYAWTLRECAVGGGYSFI